MRNEQFVPLVMELARETTGVTKVQTLAEAGDTKHPCGFVVTTKGRSAGWQAMQQLADGEKHESPTADVEGQPASWEDVRVWDGGEAWLAAVIGRAELPVIARIERWSGGGTGAARKEGVTVFFHNGSRSFLRRL